MNQIKRDWLGDSVAGGFIGSIVFAILYGLTDWHVFAGLAGLAIVPFMLCVAAAILGPIIKTISKVLS
ncbi:hypothetical protein [Neptuniibacter halophilus]|uniref:hypothetical protein n=1 Tax=Neptuniibacter halophilus TaxID=651666 RepID=UPI0025722F53|nr:hypothetical protein [Neptuniibacter halophilus]